MTDADPRPLWTPEQQELIAAYLKQTLWRCHAPQDRQCYSCGRGGATNCLLPVVGLLVDYEVSDSGAASYFNGEGFCNEHAPINEKGWVVLGDVDKEAVRKRLVGW